MNDRDDHAHCPRCGRPELQRSERRLSRVIGERWFSTTIVIERCEACDWSLFPIDQIRAHDRTIATRVALFGPINNETFRYLRRELDLSVNETARLVDLEPAAIEAIETRRNSESSPPIVAWLKLAHLVRDRAAGSTSVVASTQKPSIANTRGGVAEQEGFGDDNNHAAIVTTEAAS